MEKKLDKKVSLCISSDLLERVKRCAQKHYFSSVQDYVRMAVLINVEVDEEKENSK